MMLSSTDQFQFRLGGRGANAPLHPLWLRYCSSQSLPKLPLKNKAQFKSVKKKLENNNLVLLA